ncbi:hypothetical protein B0H19DRAFT_1241209 [Mycena capillaripes]|nr:hypothetical protein B0H19DRAFT_1241209 [Mycena capillaripes]
MEGKCGGRAQRNRGKRRGRTDEEDQDYERRREADGGGERMVLVRMKRQEHRWMRKKSEVPRAQEATEERKARGSWSSRKVWGGHESKRRSRWGSGVCICVWYHRLSGVSIQIRVDAHGGIAVDGEAIRGACTENRQMGAWVTRRRVKTYDKESLELDE